MTTATRSAPARSRPGRSALARYALAAALVRLADEGARVALALLALQRSGGVAFGGVLVAVLLAPHVLAAPVVGALADRVRRPQLLVAGASAGYGASLVAAALLVGRAPAAVPVLALLVGGCCGPAVTGALSSRLPDVVEADRLPRAFGVDALTYNSAGIVGPALAAVVATATSAAVATLVLATSAIVGAALIAALPAGREARPATEGAGPVQGLLAFVRAPVLGVVSAATTVNQVAWGAMPVVVTLVAQRAGAADRAGLILAAAAAGALVGSLAWTARPGSAERGPAVVMVALVATGLPLLVAPVHPTPLVLAVLAAVSGVAVGPMTGALFLTRHRTAPPEVESQVFTLAAGMKITASAIGAAAAGALSGWTTTALLVSVAAVSVAAGLGGAVALAAVSRRSSRGARASVAPRSRAARSGGTR
jgi:hypothetical protein